MNTNPGTLQRENIFFDSDGQLFKHIGRNQIDSETVALIEIVKNSYDADATEVIIKFENVHKNNGEIIVTDNGHGMTDAQFKSFWMRPGTAHKEKEQTSPTFGRIMLGRKGMGRFGTDKIGSTVVVKSKTKDKGFGFAVTIDADAFEKPNAKFQSTPIPLMLLTKNEIKFVERNYESGTQIRMKKLRRTWTKRMILEVRDELCKMISPDNSSSNFNIIFDVKNDNDLSGRLESYINKEHSHELNIKVDNKDAYKIDINGKTVREGNVITDCTNLFASEDSNNDDLEIKDNFKSFGPITGKILYFEKGGLKSHSSSKHGKRADHTGVKLYRAGFIVKPYGEKNNDWLKLKAKRNTKGWRYYINADKIMGYISIDPHNNPNLEDTTNRQGLIDNDEKNTFEFFFSNIVIEELNKVLERETNKQKEINLRKRYQNVSRQVAKVLSKLRSDPIKNVVDTNNKRKKVETQKVVLDSHISDNGTEGRRKTHEETNNKKKNANEPEKVRGVYNKHKRNLSETNRNITRPMDAWIGGTRWKIRPDDQPNDELEAWINEDEQEIIYNIGHQMFNAAEQSDKTIGKELESGSGIAVQMHIHKSIALAWGMFHDEKEKGTFFERYNDYIQLAAKTIREESKKFIEGTPDEELEDTFQNN